jgi:hypothetical protein
MATRFLSFQKREFNRAVGPLIVGHKTFQVSDGYRFIHLSPPAGFLAGVGANRSADKRQGVFPADQGQGFLKLTLGDKGDITLDADMGRAFGLTRRGPQPVDGEGGGHCLGEMTIDRLAPVQPLVEIGRDLDRANGNTIPATRTTFLFYKARFAMEGDLKAARFSADTGHPGPGEHLDIGVAGHLDQFGGNHAGGAVIGRKGLVQLGHDPADADVLIHQEDFEASIGQIQGGLHPGYAGPDHQNGTDLI